ncbi:MAG: GNAT family N-acetyltransferase [Spirochaetaceae bacterium]|nr:GNAT family N-acetyltransferase [Spirochaetaceae bacterium]
MSGEPEYEPRQLSMTMRRDRLLRLSGTRVREGYELRRCRASDSDGIAGVLGASGFQGWTTERVADFLAAPERGEGSRIVACGDRIVASTFASWQELGRSGVLDYVACHPEHRGRGLGRAVCCGVLGFFAERGYESVSLTTDDVRLPAIALYLSLGFTPDMTRDDMPGRWEKIMGQLGTQSR